MGPAWLDLECCEWILFHWIDDLQQKLMSLKLCIFCCVFNVCLLLLLLLSNMPMQIQFLKWFSFEGCALDAWCVFQEEMTWCSCESQGCDDRWSWVFNGHVLEWKMILTDQAHWWFSLGASKVCISWKLSLW